jgi:hypothetical protein
MLPDLRIVIAAVLSTFVLTVGVGFYASSRLINEPKKRADSLAALEESPVNRIALSWPEPIRQSEPLALDFAVTARALRNPVREVTSEPAAPVPQPLDSAVTAPEPARPAVSERPAKSEGPIQAHAASDAIASAPEPDIRIAVQYPPIVDLPRELRAPAAPAAATGPSSLATPPQVAAPPVTTGSIAATPATDEPRAAEPQPDRAAPDSAIARLPEPADAGTPDNPALKQSEPAKPVAKQARKKASPKKAAKKAAAAKAAKRPVRRAVSRATPRIENNFPMNFFGLSTN